MPPAFKIGTYRTTPLPVAGLPPPPPPSWKNPKYADVQSKVAQYIQQKAPLPEQPKG